MFAVHGLQHNFLRDIFGRVGLGTENARVIHREAKLPSPCHGPDHCVAVLRRGTEFAVDNVDLCDRHVMPSKGTVVTKAL